jgi:hypothetical protein
MAKLRRAPTSPEEGTARKLAELDRRLRNRDRVTTEAAHRVSDAGEPAFAGAWGNSLGFGWRWARFWKDPNGFVWLAGQVGGGVAGTTIFTLPAGYRTLAQGGFGGMNFAVAANGAYGSIFLADDGQVQHSVGATTNVSLEGIRFRAEG